MLRRFAAVILSAILLAPGWLGLSGMTLFAGLVPLLWISDSYGDSQRDWWRMFGWAALAFALWNVLTVWWIWYATPVGPVAATAVNVLAVAGLVSQMSGAPVPTHMGALAVACGIGTVSQLPAQALFAAVTVAVELAVAFVAIRKRV